MPVEYDLILVAPPARVGDTLAAIEAALSPFGFRATDCVTRTSSYDEPGGPERISSMDGIGLIAERLNRWNDAGAQLAGPSAIDFEVEVQQEQLVVSGSMSHRRIQRLFDREGNADPFFRIVAQLAGAIGAEVGVLGYQLKGVSFLPWDGSSQNAPWIFFTHVASFDDGQIACLQQEGYRRLKLGEYALFVEPDFEEFFNTR